MALAISKSFSPASVKPGTSGNVAIRLREDTTSPRILPPRTLPLAVEPWSNSRSIWLPITSVAASAAPLYGTCRNFTPLSIWNSSPTSWFDEPVPPEPMVSVPGFSRASRSRSATVCTARPLRTTSTKGDVCRFTIGVKSRTGLYGAFGYSAGATLKVLFEPVSSR